MSLEADLVTYLSSVPGLTALVGARIYPLVRPQGETAAALTYQLISNPPVRVAAYWHARYQFNCWAPTYPQARAIEAQLVQALDQFHGLLGTQHVHAWALNVRDGYDPGSTEFRRIVDVQIGHQRPVF